MCGICGYISHNKINDNVLCEMRDTMVHRGPNDAGIWQTEEKGRYIGLAHRRLSIFDLSELGHQPMVTDDGNYAIAYNGEVYNFKEIRQELLQRGYSFKSECDTEVVLKSYVEWKEECFARFNGMFAISIWDKVADRLVLARDRMGVKPLYYYHKNAELVFGSELKPIMKYPEFSKNIRMDMLGNFLCNKYIASPDTIFKNTYKVIPGTYIVYHNNEVHTAKYWEAVEKKQIGSEAQERSFEECKKELDEIINDAVAKRLAADVPVGVFLSGGIDSSLIAAIAQKQMSSPIETFTIGFYDKERNEADRAKEIADYLGTKHNELYVEEKDILDLIENITTYYDEPFSDSSQLPTMLVSKLASDNVTVALSGDGGDELFCGYKMYDWSYIAQKTDFIGSMLYHFPGMNAIKEKLHPELRAFINNRDKDYKTQLFIDVMTEQAMKILPGVGINPKFEYEEALKYKNWQERRMVLDMLTYLPDEVMAKTDRASMKYSLEVRNPLLDYRLVEKSFSIPHKYKYHGNDKKYILKQMAYDYIPRKLLDQPKKGFGVPLRKWLRTVLSGEVQKYTSEVFVKGQGIFDPAAITCLVEMQKKSDKIMYSSMLWSYYMFQKWWQEYIQ